MNKVVARFATAFCVIAAATLSACSGSDGQINNITGAASAAGNSSFAGSPGTAGFAGAPEISVAGSGSSDGTGGAAQAGTGGDTTTGGAAGTGGSSTGGSAGVAGTPVTGGAAGTGGAVSTGGNPSGGSAGTGGDTTTGGAAGTGGSSTGGSAGVGGEPSTGGQPPVMTPFSCGTPTPMPEFPVAFDFAKDVWASGPNDVRVAVSSAPSGQAAGIMEWDGARWINVTLPEVPNASWVTMPSISGDWAGGATMEPRKIGKPQLLHRVNGAWVLDNSITYAVSEVMMAVRSFGDDVFVLTDKDLGKPLEESRIIRKTDSLVTDAALPSNRDPQTRIEKLWGTSTSDVYAIGQVMDAETGNIPVKAVLWHYDGNDQNQWEAVTSLPADLVALTGVSGADGELIVSGYTAAKAFVVLITSDLQSWTRFNRAATESVGWVHMPRVGAAAIGVGATDGQGMWKLSVLSEDVLTSSIQVQEGLNYSRAAFFAGTSGFIAADSPGYGRIYSVTCQ